MTGVAVFKSITQCRNLILHIHAVHTHLTNCTYYFAYQFYRCSHHQMPIAGHLTRTISNGVAVLLSTMLCHASSQLSTHKEYPHFPSFVCFVASTPVCTLQECYGAGDSILQTSVAERGNRR